jgi:hypothetical protein
MTGPGTFEVRGDYVISELYRVTVMVILLKAVTTVANNKKTGF